MNIRQRLSRLENRLGKASDCPLCRNGKIPEVVEVRAIMGDRSEYLGTEAPPAPTPCPECGRERIQVAVVKFA